jgi:integrase
VLFYCGLRWGELAALRVGRVDTMRRRIKVAESVTEDVATLVWGDPKNHQRRSVPIPRFLVDELDVLKAGKGPKDLLFIGARGGVLRNGNFRRDVLTTPRYWRASTGSRRTSCGIRRLHWRSALVPT